MSRRLPIQERALSGRRRATGGRPFPHTRYRSQPSIRSSFRCTCTATMCASLTPRGSLRIEPIGMALRIVAPVATNPSMTEARTSLRPGGVISLASTRSRSAVDTHSDPSRLVANLSTHPRRRQACSPPSRERSFDDAVDWFSAITHRPQAPLGIGNIANCIRVTISEFIMLCHFLSFSRIFVAREARVSARLPEAISASCATQFLVLTQRLPAGK
jgi:hypothetical protein